MVTLRRLSPLALTFIACAVGAPGGSFGDQALSFGDDTASTKDTEPSAETAAGDTQDAVDPTGTGGQTQGDTASACPSEGEVCETEMPGVCATGVTQCEGGDEACVPDQEPAAELCNDLDDDCNGEVDDGEPESGEACDTGMPGACAMGLTQCSAGAVECVEQVAASAELCDGIDNDCNGTVDDGNPEGGAACLTGLSGACSAGTQQCMAGTLSCVQTTAQAPSETCNNALDDDCNGLVDDGCDTCSHDVCVEGVALVSGCNACATAICAADPFCCNNTWDGICVTAVGNVCAIAC